MSNEFNIVQLKINVDNYRDADHYKELTGTIKCYFFQFALQNLFTNGQFSLGRIIQQAHGVQLVDGSFWKHCLGKDKSEKELLDWMSAKVET